MPDLKQIQEKLQFDLAFYRMTGIKTSFLIRCEEISKIGCDRFEAILGGEG